MASDTTAIRIRNWFETFMTAEQIAAHAETNGDASIDDLYARVAASINTGDRTLDQFLTSLISATPDNGVLGITNMITKRGLTAADVLAGLIVPGLDLGTATTDTIALVLSEADYWQRETDKEFCIRAVLSLPSSSDIAQQRKLALPWAWNSTDAVSPPVPADGDDDIPPPAEPVYCFQVRGTAELEINWEIVHPNDEVDFLSAAMRRKARNWIASS